MNEEGVDGLLAWWEAQPRRRRNDLNLKVALIQRLIDCNDHESAYEFTLEALKKWGDNTPLSPTLCTQITRLQPIDNTKLIKIMEKRAKHTDESQQCGVNRALGYLYVRNNEFAKAAEVFKKVIACPKQLESNDAMMAAYVFEQAGDKAAAEQIRQESLRNAMSIQPEEMEKTKKIQSLFWRRRRRTLVIKLQISECFLFRIGSSKSI
ncbi:protein hemY [Rodentibacter pneumotropicus]|uniref:Protein hemY n=1 Tax=Rodentibacter pneumotropicus TaxID=758 RepID=A0A448MJK4_9PAST|nr:protein hemY [Rodentibacter pneumotropicus]